MSDSEKSNSLTVSNSQTIATVSTVLVRRGLAHLSTTDTARVIKAGMAITSSLQMDHVLRTVMEEINDLIKVGTWSLFLANREKGELYCQIATGEHADELKDLRIKIGEGIVGSVAQKGEPLVVPDVNRDSRFVMALDGRGETIVQSIVAAPLLLERECLGVIELINCVGSEGYPESDLSVLRTFADFTAIALANARHVQRIHELTITDDLTGLYNFRHLSFMLDTEIRRSSRYGFEFSLMALNVTDFASLLASRGRTSVNALIETIAKDIKPKLRLIDLAFYGGYGEFLMLLPQTSCEAACDVGLALSERMSALSRDYHVGTCIAFVTFPKDGKTKTDLVRRLDESVRTAEASMRDSRG